jgi:hypothetical protein
MTTYQDKVAALDQLVVDAGKALDLPATRDPSVMGGLVAQGLGCVWVGKPLPVSPLLAARQMDVPVSLVAPAPSDLRAVDFLIRYEDDLMEFLRSSDVTEGPLSFGDLLFPAVTVTARIAY